MTTGGPTERETFDIYTDSSSIAVGPYGVTLVLQISPAQPGMPGQVVNSNLGAVRMSLEHAKVLAMMLRKQLKAFEDAAGYRIRVMPQAMNQVGLSEEDWDSI